MKLLVELLSLNGLAVQPTPAAEEITEAKVNVGSHIVIDDQAKALKAVDKLLEAGFELDLSFSMGKYYFNFKDESIADEARKVLGGK